MDLVNSFKGLTVGQPQAIIPASDGALYGLSLGGSDLYDAGSIFRLMDAPLRTP